jgi:N6-adenosine-specific RNA methylase IME4
MKRLVTTIVADPAWPYNDAIDSTNGRRGASTQYATSNLQEIFDQFTIAQLEAGVVASGVGHLYLWTTNAFMVEAHQVARRWGYAPKTIITWIKGRLVLTVAGDEVDRPYHAAGADAVDVKIVNQIGQGHYFSNNTEHVLFCVRGNLRTKVRGVPTYFLAPRPSVATITAKGKAGTKIVHSKKPAAFYDLVERMSPGAYFEMHARSSRPGWIHWGNETGKLDAPIAAAK